MVRRQLGSAWALMLVTGAVTLLLGTAIGQFSFAQAPKAAQPQAVVAAHLQAGEYGAALTLAQSVTNPADRASLIQSVAAAQRAAGEFKAADNTARRLPSRTDRVGQQQASAQSRSLAGGSNGADFTQLVQLIQEQTGGSPDGPWLLVDGQGGTMTPFPNGVRVDAQGVLYRSTIEEHNGLLQAQGLRARKAALNAELAKPTPLRVVSLTRLEREVARQLEAGERVPESMQQLAGITQVRYVFFDARQNEVLLAGPAEGWQYDSQGQPVGVDSGRPTLHLDDLVVLMRTYFSGQADFGCSINTRDEGVKSLQEFAQASLAKGPLAPGAVKNWVTQLQKKLGRQDIVVWGVPADSRVARVIVEADYRMKLIGIEKLNVGKEIPSYFALLPMNQQKDPPAMEALRWWLSLKCDAVLHSEDRSAYEFQGAAVQCLSENQQLTAEGKHLPTGKAEGTNRLFAENFTRNYDKLASREPVFADAANIFDLALAACLIQQEVKAGRVSWQPGEFSPRGTYQTSSYSVPREVDSVVNHRVFNGKDIVVQVAGGVRPDPRAILKEAETGAPAPRLANVAKRAHAPQLPEGRWWWDAAE